MKKTDHRELAEYWVQEMRHRIPLTKRLAFIFGNIEPDMNYLTYLHGFTHYRNFLGHHFEHAFPVLLDLIDRYENSLFSITAYYRLGKCFHYTADIFTYPHNSCFPGSMKDHVDYEVRLHEFIQAADMKHTCSKYYGKMFYENRTAEDIKAALKRMHDRYLSEEHECGHDLRYIVSATGLLAEAFLYTEEERTERIYPEEPILIPTA